MLILATYYLHYVPRYALRYLYAGHGMHTHAYSIPIALINISTQYGRLMHVYSYYTGWAIRAPTTF